MSIRRLAVLITSTLLVAAGVSAVWLHPQPARADTTSVAVADAAIDSSHPDHNAGSERWVSMDSNPDTYAFFKFDVRVPSGDEVTSAEFRCAAGTASAGRARLWTASNSWDEDTITWSNAPSPDRSGGAAGRTGDVDRDGYVSADVTGVISGPGTYTLVGITDSGVRWSCRSHDSDRPAELLITTGSGSGPPTTPGPTPTHAPRSDGHKVLVILGENHNGRQALDQMPHLASWAATYGEATDYSALTHPSLPNYLAIWGGSMFGVTSNCRVGSSGCVPDGPSVFGQTLAAGKTARAYQESMPSNCATGGSGDYAPRHGPWAYWTDPAERAGCEANDVSSGTPSHGNLRDDIDAGRLPVTGELTPNLCNDAHDCSLGTFDRWLADWVPTLMAGPDYRGGDLTIVITFDEDDGGRGNNIAFVVIDPRLSGRTVTGSFDHYSLTRWLDDNAGVARLRHAAGARDLRSAFGL